MVGAGPIRFVVIGDATLDVTVRLSGSPAAGSDRAAAITLGPGGQGANMAVRLARRGARVSLVTAMADDIAGQQLTDALAEDGVSLVALPALRTGVVVSLVNAGGERAMLSDRVSMDVAGLDTPAVRSTLEGADWIHLSGYPLADSARGDGLAAMVAARRAGQGCSVGGGSFGLGSDVPTRLHILRPELVLFDRAEASALLASDAGDRVGPLDALAEALASAIGGTAVVTDGAAGAAASTGDGTVAVPGWPGSAVDATGAGDAFGAGILLALCDGAWPPALPALRSALEEASRVGAEVAGEVGSQARVASES